MALVHGQHGTVTLFAQSMPKRGVAGHHVIADQILGQDAGALAATFTPRRACSATA